MDEDLLVILGPSRSCRICRLTENAILTLMLMFIGSGRVLFKLLSDLVEQLRQPIWRLRPWGHAAVRVVHAVARGDVCA